MKQDWFKDWFNTKYYHTLYKSRNYQEAQHFIQKLVDELSIPKTEQILDLACGKGRHSIFLNGLGYSVVGVDLSEESIITASKFETSNLKFDVHDMRETYKLNAFENVFNLFTSFGYFEKEEENQQAVDAMYSNLKDKGILVLDFMNTKKVLNRLVKEEAKEIDGIKFNITRELENNFITKKINFFDAGKDYSFEESVKALYKSDFERYFMNSGFNIQSVFGDYSLNKFDEENSDRLIFVCKK